MLYLERLIIMKKQYRIIMISSLALLIISGSIIIFAKYTLRSTLAHYMRPSFFEDFATWYSSSKRKTNNTLGDVVSAMNTTKTTFSDIVEAGEQFVDINGDGLLDFLYYGKASFGNPWTDEKSAVFINKGNFSFDPIYKCVIYSPDGPNYPATWYGDCAQ
jgi:hypothetical protein